MTDANMKGKRMRKIQKNHPFRGGVPGTLCILIVGI